MDLVKRSVVAEQLESYPDQLAAANSNVAIKKKQLADCKVIAVKAYKAEQALHDHWKELTAKRERLQEKHAKLREQNAFLQKQLSTKSSQA